MYRFPAEVDHAVANQVLAAAVAAQDGPERVYDLSACEHFDSSLVALLLELARGAQAAGASARFEGAGEKLLKLAGLYGVGALLFGPAARAAGGAGAPIAGAGA
ncbi:MAG: lipid asymmetry maintenance protein MlaB [Gammaproteobacteria bacterium]